MSSAKITLLSFYEWLKWEESDLFTELTLPEGIDKDILTNNILIRGGEFEVVFSDPHFMQKAIGNWGKKWYRTFEKWIDALNIEYNPLENYDRMEDYTDTTNRGLTSSGRKDSGNTRTFDNEDKETLDRTDELTHDTTQENEHTVSAYDSSTYQPADKNVTDMEGTETTTHTGTDTFNHTGTITDEYGEGVSGSEKENTTAKHTGRLHGNIGVTTSQQMLEAELDVAKWNIYEHITDIFLEEFIIPIYS